LSLARRIIQLHKGRITVNSTPGKGSVFYVRLPTAGTLK
jgi:signal transduction histidine kinase